MKKKSAAVSAWSAFNPAAMPVHAPFLVRAKGGQPVTVTRNQFKQVINAETGHLLTFPPDEMRDLPSAAAAPWSEDSASSDTL